MEQYNQALDATYDRRGWTRDGVPTPERLIELGIDLPELMAIVQQD
jgi:aldehyde:ferredoxin oxidoreductase